MCRSAHYCLHMQWTFDQVSKLEKCKGTAATTTKCQKSSETIGVSLPEILDPCMILTNFYPSNFYENEKFDLITKTHQ